MLTVIILVFMVLSDCALFVVSSDYNELKKKEEKDKAAKRGQQQTGKPATTGSVAATPASVEVKSETSQVCRIKTLKSRDLLSYLLPYCQS